jgi:O-antigen/teichoic acid export membrane protein
VKDAAHLTDAPTIDDLLGGPQAGLVVIRGGALRALGYVGGILLGLASAPVLLRYLGVADFGRYTVIISLATLVGGITEAGLAFVGLREYSVRDQPERGVVMRELLGIRLVLSAAGAAVAVVIALLAGYDHVLVLGTLVVSAGVLVQALQSLLSVGLTGTLRFGWLTVAELAKQIVAVCLVIALVVAGAGLLGLFAVQFFAGIVALGITIGVVRQLMPFRPSFDLTRWWPLLRHTLPYTAATAVNIVYFRVGVIIVSLAASAQQTGYFATSQRILETLVILPALVVSAVFPMLARSAAEPHPTRMRYLVDRVLVVALIFGVWMSLVLILGAGPIIGILAGAGYEPAVDVLRIQAIALLATFVAIACQFPLLALHRHQALLTANLAALVTSVGLGVALVPPLGARGGALATVGAELVLAAAAGFALVRADRGLRLPFGIIPPVALAAAAAAVLTAIPGLPDLVVCLLASGLYFGILFVMGRVPIEVLDALSAWRKHAPELP